eukprot:525660-Pleurochrysis_carterae.AAC.1
MFERQRQRQSQRQRQRQRPTLARSHLRKQAHAKDNAENHVSIAAAGGIGPLVELAGSGTSDAKEKAAAALMNLA